MPGKKVNMAKYREISCKYYLSFGECKKGREASQTGYCQKCDKYYPRVRVRCLNKKKLYNNQLRKKDFMI